MVLHSDASLTLYSYHTTDSFTNLLPYVFLGSGFDDEQENLYKALMDVRAAKGLSSP
jgi:hypothetical protein